MIRTRVIPCLLLSNGGLVKTVGFKEPSYVGDPINAVRIFNEKQVDELMLLDIDASRDGRAPDYELIEDIVSEAFMPIAYGGGVSTLGQATRLVTLGAEKVVINTAALHNVDVIHEISNRLGSQSVVVSINAVKRSKQGYQLFNSATRKTLKIDLVEHLKSAVGAGAGEVLVNDVARDGTLDGYDLDLVEKVTTAVDVPVVVCGGAGRLKDFALAVSAGASAVAAGSMFVYVGKHKAVMINYPAYKELRDALGD